ncbi:MAG: hypothetical protein GDA56_31230 [Hormoscilla sp. GM7CHS1pb]|nr:hypothetical protein [Hormoscilla sp. GM7CHS1pb]
MPTYSTAEEFVTAMRSQLLAGDFYAAQKLSTEAIEQYPDREEVKKLAYLLAPSVVTVDRDTPRYRDTQMNQDWIEQNRMQYKGRWIALKDGKLLADGPHIDEIGQQLGDLRNTGIYVTAIY